jgi:hypothetical protein
MLSWNQEKRLQKVFHEIYYVVDSFNDDEGFVCKLTGSQMHVYKVIIYNGHAKCDCPDGKLNSSRLKTWCKHVCFLVTKVGRFGSDVIEKRHLSETQVCNIQSRLAHFLNKDLQDVYKKSLIINDDECCICYDSLEKDVVTCSTCRHAFHKLCMDTWIKKGGNTCVYCRTPICLSIIGDGYVKLNF